MARTFRNFSFTLPLLAAAALAQTPMPQAVTLQNGVMMRSGVLGAAIAPAGNVAYAVVNPVDPARGNNLLAGVTGQPFSARQEGETVQTLADGTHITRAAEKLTYYRDSVGRLRTERTAPAPPGLPADTTLPVFIEIVDPVAGCTYSYSSDPANRTVHRFPYTPAQRGAAFTTPPPPPPPAMMPGQTAGSASVTSTLSARRPAPAIVSESLGSKDIEGVTAQGNRITTTWPVNSLGNDRPISTVSEIWGSRDLRLPVILSTMSDPRTGDFTTRLVGISRAEPDASLFLPPAGYEILDAPSPSVFK